MKLIYKVAALGIILLIVLVGFSTLTSAKWKIFDNKLFIKNDRKIHVENGDCDYDLYEELVGYETKWIDESYCSETLGNGTCTKYEYKLTKKQKGIYEETGIKYKGKGKMKNKKISFDTKYCIIDGCDLICWHRRDGYSKNRNASLKNKCRSGESCIIYTLNNNSFKHKKSDLGGIQL